MVAMDDGRIKAIVDWLTDGARTAAAPQQVLQELCERMIDAGVPLWRAAAFVRTLHPQIMGRRFLWVRDVGVSVSEAPHDLLATPTYRDSPVARVCLSGKGLRRRLSDPACPIDLNTLAELREEGVTDYVAKPLIFTDGAVHAATWTTRAPGGFSDAHIAAIDSVTSPLARVAEVRALRRMAGNLLDTYVGHQSGERILSGHVRRGDSETIAAAIWLSDMRGFTVMADRLPPETTIELLNSYFDCQVPAIAEHGGEVLKFIGDGLLAIFPIAGRDTDGVCRQALEAARLARQNIAALDAPSWSATTNGPRFGLALHLGEVLYGNIGGGDRLDFTCIGPAVNMAARIERLAASLGRTVLASSRFAHACPAELAGLGDFMLPGFSDTQAIYGLADEPGQVMTLTPPDCPIA